MSERSGDPRTLRLVADRILKGWQKLPARFAIDPGIPSGCSRWSGIKTEGLRPPATLCDPCGIGFHMIVVRRNALICLRIHSYVVLLPGNVAAYAAPGIALGRSRTSLFDPKPQAMVQACRNAVACGFGSNEGLDSDAAHKKAHHDVIDSGCVSQLRSSAGSAG